MVRDPDDVRAIADPYERFRAATSEIERYRRAITELGAIRARAASVLHASGLPYREIGKKLGLSTPRVAQLVTSSEAEARLLRVSTMIELELASLAMRLGLAVSTTRPVATLSALYEAGWLARNEYSELRRLRNIRNRIAHAVAPISGDEIQQGLKIADHMLVVLHSRNEQLPEKVDLHSKGSGIAMPQLRQFLYRDEDQVREFLAQLEGGIYDEDAQTTRSSRKGSVGAGVKAGPLSAQGERGGEGSDEVSRVIKQTGASEFERLFKLLGDDVQYLDNIDEDIWKQLQRGEIVEVEAIVRPAGFDRLLDLFTTFQEILPVAEAMGADATIDDETIQIMQMLKALNKGGPADTTSVVASLASAPQFKFACTLRTSHLLVNPGLLEGEATVFGKIRRKLRPGESYMLSGIFAGLEELFGDTEKDELVKLFDDPQMKALGVESPKVVYPAAVLTPIAIYR
jgi:hypothetical protein